MYQRWVDLCKLSMKVGGTRTINLPETLSEAIFCIDMNVGRCVEGISGSKSSFDHYDHKQHRRIQLKAPVAMDHHHLAQDQYTMIFISFLEKWLKVKKKRKHI